MANEKPSRADRRRPLHEHNNNRALVEELLLAVHESKKLLEEASPGWQGVHVGEAVSPTGQRIMLVFAVGKGADRLMAALKTDEFGRF